MENLNEKLEAQLKEINLLVNKSNRSLYKFQDLPMDIKLVEQKIKEFLL